MTDSTTYHFYKESDPPKQQLLGSDDFISLYGLTSVYNEYVKPYVVPVGGNTKPTDKIDKSIGVYIRDLPGKNKIKRDHYLRDLVMAPSAADVTIAPFDMETLKEGFTLYPGDIPGFDASVLGGDDDIDEEEAAERKRRKKERKSGEKKKKKKRKREGEGDGEDGGDALEEDHIVVD